jgi:hypothetical protein
MNIRPKGDGSHLETLMRVVNLTDGAILELGMGMYSTPYLHFACLNRRLVSFENNPDCFQWGKTFATDNHTVTFVKDWNDIDISGKWSVALIDHAPTSQRVIDILRLADNTDYIVVHDSHRLSLPTFRYRKDYDLEKPFTTILSNSKII